MSAVKDRHSRMAESSVNAGVSKGGAGAHSWGTPMSSAEFTPMGVVGQPTMMIAPAPTQYVYQMPQTVPMMSEFPALGAPVKVQTGPVAWGPSIVAANVAALGQDHVRTGVHGQEVFDSSHPRHLFAKQTRNRGDGVHQMAVDWTQPGTAGVHHHIMTFGANPAHLASHQLAAVQAQPHGAVVRPAMTQAYPSVQQYVQAPHMQQYIMQPQVAKHAANQPQMNVRREQFSRGR